MYAGFPLPFCRCAEYSPTKLCPYYAAASAGATLAEQKNSKSQVDFSVSLQAEGSDTLQELHPVVSSASTLASLGCFAAAAAITQLHELRSALYRSGMTRPRGR